MGYVAAHGAGDNILTFVVGHGSLELGAIVLAGGAGLPLGWSIVAPGDRTRVASLQAAARSVVFVVFGAAVMLFMAAAVEGFWSASTLPSVVKRVRRRADVRRWCWPTSSSRAAAPTQAAAVERAEGIRSMDLMRARVALRERALLDVLDLAIRFCAAHAGPYAEAVARRRSCPRSPLRGRAARVGGLVGRLDRDAGRAHVVRRRALRGPRVAPGLRRRGGDRRGAAGIACERPRAPRRPAPARRWRSRRAASCWDRPGSGSGTICSSSVEVWCSSRRGVGGRSGARAHRQRALRGRSSR